MFRTPSVLAALGRRTNTTAPPALWARLVIAGVFALVGGAIAWHAQYLLNHPGGPAAGGDHRMLWRAARDAAHRIDPYHIVGFKTVPEPDSAFYYPLSAVVLGAPFAWLPKEPAMVAFVILSMFLFGFAITADGFARLPVIGSIPFLLSAHLGQSTPIICAAAMLPGLGFLLVTKPNLGLPLFLRRPTRAAAVGGAVLLAASLAYMPHWPWRWLLLTSNSQTHEAPWLLGFGMMGLLAALRWREPDARLLLAMTIIPHGMYFYDDLPLWLIPRTLSESLVLTAASWVAWTAYVLFPGGVFGVPIAGRFATLIYPIALLIIFSRPDAQGRRWFRRRGASRDTPTSPSSRVGCPSEFSWS